MIKRITDVNEAVSTTVWLDLIQLAGVFACDAPAPWRAAAPGVQTICLRFRRPVRLTRIHLVFEERAVLRTQEFVLRWQAAGNQQSVDIARRTPVYARPPFL